MTALILAFLLWFAGSIALPVLSFVRASRAMRTAERLEREVRALRQRLEEAQGPPPPRPDAAEAEAAAAGEPSGPPPAPAAVPPEIAAPERIAPAEIGPWPPPGEPVEPPMPVADEASPPPPGQPAGAPPPPTPAAPATLEERIGSRWLLYTGIGALVLGTSYFVKYSFDQGWITAGMRVTLGVVAGIVLTLAGLRFVRSGFPLYGQLLAGGGLAISYLSVYAANTTYALIGQPLAFALLAAIAAVAAVLADRLRSPGLALSAVLGGFATPFLVGPRLDSQVALLGYTTVLVAATMYLARRRDWPALNLVSFLLTCLVMIVWLGGGYTAARYLSTELFLSLYAAMFLYVLHESRRSRDPLAPLVTGVLLLAPVLYHGASLAILLDHPLALLVYLIAITAVGIILSAQVRPDVPRAAIWAGVALPFLGWLAWRTRTGWLLPSVVTLISIYGLHLAAHVRGLRRDPVAIAWYDTLILHANGLWLFAGLYVLIAPRSPDWLGPAAALVASWNAALALAWRSWHREAPWHYVGLAFALGCVAVALQFDGAWVVALWAAEGAALVWLGLRVERGWLRVAGGALLLAATVGLLDVLESPVGVQHTPLLNTGALTAALVIALYHLVARRYGRGTPTPAFRRNVSASLVAANLVTLAWLTFETNAFFRTRGWQTPGPPPSAVDTELARQLALSIVWGTFALVLVGVGFVRRARALRYLGIAVFAATVLKVALVDLQQLDRLSQIASVLGIGVLLLVASYLYQRYRRRLDTDSDAAVSGSGVT